MSDWFVYALLGAFMAALVSILAKVGLQRVDPVTATALRSLVMTALVFTVLYYTRGFSDVFRLNQREYIYVVLSGLAGGLSWVLYFTALQGGEASRVAVVDRSSVVLVVLLRSTNTPRRTHSEKNNSNTTSTCSTNTFKLTI